VARLADTAYTKLRGQILSGDLVHGERLAEEELAETLGISRTPVREALRRLASEGLVEVTPNRGASVAQWDTADLQEIFDLRSILESHATERAAVMADTGVTAALSKICDAMDGVFARMDGEKSLPALADLNRRFHTTIIEAAKSPRLASMVESLTHVPVVMQTFSKYSPTALERSLRHHREIVDAVKAHDSVWAGSVMRAHILAARDEVLGCNGMH
jgi:DNA-binding GntR family transcriptional regulator